MRTGPLPSRRKRRTNHSEVGKRRCEWQIRLMEEGGPKGWAASPVSPLHQLPTQDPAAPHPPGGLALLGGAAWAPSPPAGCPSAPSVPFPLALYHFPCCPRNEKITSYLTWWDSALNPSLHILKPQHTHSICSPIPPKDFLLGPHRAIGMHSTSPCCGCQNRAGARYQLPQLSCAGEREDERFGQISTQPRPSRVEREEAKRPLAPSRLAPELGWPAQGRVCKQGSSLSLFLSILHFAVQGGEHGARQPRKLGLLSHRSPVISTVTSVLWRCHPRSGSSLSASLRFDGGAPGWTSFWMGCRDLSGKDR